MAFIRAFFYLYLFILPFYPALSIINIGGYPIVTIYNLAMLALALLLFFLKRKETMLHVLLVVTILISLIISVLLGWSAVKSVTNICLYVIPVLIFVMVDKAELTLDVFSNIMSISLTISAILSILALIGVLTKSSGFYVNIYYVDGAAGIIGIVLCLYRALSVKKRYNLLQTILLGVNGVIVVLLGQSRARLLVTAVSVALIVLSLIYVNKDSYNRRITRRVVSIVFIALISGFVVYRFVPSFSQYVDNIILRLNMLGQNDINVTYRESEASLYIQMFRDNPLFGRGWGILYNSQYLNSQAEQYMAHNMFAALLGVGGLVFCVPYFAFLLSLLKQSVVGVIKNRDELKTIALISLIDVVLLGIGSAGFGKLSGVLFMTLIFVCLNKKASLQPEQRTKSQAAYNQL